MAIDLPDEDEFLAGPGGGELDIDPVFAKSFERAIEEMERFAPGSLEVTDDALVTPSLLVPGFTFVEVPCGVALRDPSGKIVGGYLSCDLVLASEHRGRGLGMEIVIEQFLRAGELPTWNLDAPAYSPDGWQCHLRAHEWMRGNPALVQKKLAPIEAHCGDGSKPSLG